MARGLLQTRAMRLLMLAAVMVVTSGCYVGFKGGPSFHSRNGRAVEKAGAEYEITAGVELYFDKPAVLNPLAGKTRLATGGGGFSSDAPGGEPAAIARTASTDEAAPAQPAFETGQRASGGLWTVEFGRTLTQDTWSGGGRDPDSGGLIRAVGSFGAGSGTLSRTGAGGDALASTGMSVLSYAAGVELAMHGGGSSIDSIGLAVGLGAKVSHYTGDDGSRGDSVTPYVSVTLEGGILLQVLGEMLKGVGRAGCR